MNCLAIDTHRRHSNVCFSSICSNSSESKDLEPWNYHICCALFLIYSSIVHSRKQMIYVCWVYSTSIHKEGAKGLLIETRFPVLSPFYIWTSGTLFLQHHRTILVLSIDHIDSPHFQYNTNTQINVAKLTFG